MSNKTKTQKASNMKTSPAETGKKAGYNGDYTGYFYRQIDRLWEAYEHMTSRVLELEARLKEVQ